MKSFYPAVWLSAILVLISFNINAQPTSAGYALKFDGTSDYVKLTHQGQFDFTNSFTVEAWIKVTFDGTSMSIVNKGDSGWRFQISSSGVLAFQTVGLTPANLVGTILVTDGNWHHVAAVYDGGGAVHNTRIFVDGVLDVSATVTGTLSGNAFNVCIAANAETTNRFFKGTIDEMRIWSEVRSTNEIPNSMRKLLVGDEANLVSYLRFDDGSGTKASDDSPNGNFGSLSNSPTWVVSTAPIGPPGLTTLAATAVTESSVTLNATVNAEQQASGAYFSYGITTSYGATSSKSLFSSSITNGTLTKNITGLAQGTLYHFRAEGTNEAGTGTGTDLTFTTWDAAAVGGAYATNATTNSITLYATVKPNGATTQLYFQYGLDKTYGSFSATNIISGGITSLTTNITLAGLFPASTYHYRAVATNSVGGDVGFDKTFVTGATPPAIAQQGSPSVSSRSAVVTVDVNPNGSPTTLYFRYGTNVSYGSFSATNNIGDDTFITSSDVAFSDLLPGTFYNCRLVASNIAGTTLGTNATFTTAAELPSVTTLAAGNITSTNVTFNGSATPNGAATAVYFSYGTSLSYGSVSATQSIGSGNSAVETNVVVNGLLPGVTYHFQAVGSNNVGTTTGDDLTVTLTAQAPIAVTTPAVMRTNGADLMASIDPNGAATQIYFRYGTTTNYTDVTSIVILPAGNSSVSVSNFVGGLTYGAVYHFQVVASNSVGQVLGSDATFTAPIIVPNVTTLAATSLTGNSATLNATVNPNAGNTTVYFNYGTNVSYGSVSASTIIPASLTPSSTNINLTGLLPGRVYHFQAVGANGAGSAVGNDLTFALSPVAPTLTALDVSVATNGVTLLAQVNPNGAATTVYYEYGATTNYGTYVSTNVVPFGNTSVANNSTFILGLALGQVYKYRVVASNSAGITIGTNSFTAPAGLPGVTTLAATNITGTNVTLVAAVNPNYGPTTVSFQYGTTTNYGLTSASIVIPSATNTVTTNMDVTELLPGVVHHFRVVAANTGGTAWGQDLSFAVPALAPLVSTLPAVVVSNSATMNASVNPNGAVTTVHFQYGLTTNYGSYTTNSILSAGNSFVANSRAEPGLQPGALYHFRVVAVNSVGMTFGDDVVFNVAAPAVGASNAAPQATTLAASLVGTNIVISASVNPNSAPTIAYFQYGPSTNYGSVTVTTNLAATNTFLSVSNVLPGLQLGTNYNFRVVASNSSGITFGSNLVFQAKPVAISQQVTFVENTNSAGRTIILSGFPNGITFSVARQTQYGVITNLNTNTGSCIYQPYQTTNFYGNDDFDFAVSTAGLTSAVATVTINILPTNSPPAAHPQWLYALTNTPTVITLTGDDDADAINYNLSADPVGAKYHYSPLTNGLTFTNLTSPTHGTLSGVAPNLVYTPNSNFMGLDGFTFRVKDDTTNSLSASVNIMVTNKVGAVRPFVGQFVFVQPFTTANGGTGDSNGGVDDGSKQLSLGTDKSGKPFALNFFSSLQTNLYANNNGNVTFTKVFTAYFATNLPYVPTVGPMLAPFFADVDTYANLRATDWPGPTGVATFTNAYVNGRLAFEVTWKNVPGYGLSKAATNLNTFQVVLIDRSDVAIGDFDAEFNYDQVKWLYGTASLNNAIIGYDCGNGTNAYLFPTSGTTNSLDTSSNGLVKGSFRSSVAGRYVLQFRAPVAFAQNIQVANNTSTNITLTGRLSDFAASNYTIVTAPAQGALTGLAPNLVYTPTNNYVGLDSFTFRLSDGVNSSTSRVDIVVSSGPTATTLPASEITGASATLNGLINPGQAIAVAYFQYGLTTNYGNFSMTNVFSATTNALSMISTISSLVPNTLYHYRSVASNYLGVSFGADTTFTSFPPPIVSTLSASNITVSSAVLTGSITANGAGVYYFQYGKTNHAPLVTLPISINGTNVQVVSQAVSNLSVNTTWYFRVVATNAVGVSLGNELSFITYPLPPSVTTFPATGVTATNAVLNAFVSPDADTFAYFQFGVTTNYGRFSATNFLTATNLTMSIANFASNLAPAAPCHFRVVAWNSGGTNYGADLGFTSLAAAPDVLSISVTNILSTSAGLAALVNPNGATSAVYFQYGLSTSYGSFAITNGLAATNVSLSISNVVTNLSPATVYHAGAVATNSFGTNISADVTFTTLAAQPGILLVSVTNILSTSAELNALVNPNGATSMAYFQYGLSTNYGGFSVTNALSATNVSFLLTNLVANLSPATVYHLRFVAVNSVGTNSSGDQTFTTSIAVPGVLTLGATNYGHAHIMLLGAVNPNGTNSTAFFQYGFDTNYGSASTTLLMPATNILLSLSNVVSDLVPGATYHYRLTAANGQGTNNGNDLSFALPPLPSIANAGGGVGTFGFQFGNLANESYTIEGSTNLVQWLEVTNVSSLTNGFLIFSDSDSSNRAQRFYRLRID